MFILLIINLIIGFFKYYTSLSKILLVRLLFKKIKIFYHSGSSTGFPEAG